MKKTDVKVELIKIFAETAYEKARVDEKFIANYLQIMWTNMFQECRQAIRSGRNEITISDFTVSAYSGKFPSHERDTVYMKMVPYIQEELDKNGIPYEKDFYTVSKITRFKIMVADLRTYAGAERLETLM